MILTLYLAILMPKNKNYFLLITQSSSFKNILIENRGLRGILIMNLKVLN